MEDKKDITSASGGLNDITSASGELRDINVEDPCLYIIWYQLSTGQHDNSAVQEYLEKSPSGLTREEFFSWLWNNYQFDDIFALVTRMMEEHVDFRIINFYGEMRHWVNKHLIAVIP